MEDHWLVIAGLSVAYIVKYFTTFSSFKSGRISFPFLLYNVYHVVLLFVIVSDKVYAVWVPYLVSCETTHSIMKTLLCTIQFFSYT